MFVELPSTIEGLIRITALEDDYYVYDENHLALIGERTKNIYRLGDEVKVKCSRVDIANREIYFDLIKEEEEEMEEEVLKEFQEKIPQVKKEVKEALDEMKPINHGIIIIIIKEKKHYAMTWERLS